MGLITNGIVSGNFYVVNLNYYHLRSISRVISYEGIKLMYFS